METEQLSRKERERLTRRNDILLAAQEVIAEKGFAHATLDEIAHRAEFGKGTLYNYFPDGKVAILFAILEQLFDHMVELVQTSFDGVESFREGLTAFLTNAFRFFSERSDLFMILMREVQRETLLDDDAQKEFFHIHGSRTIDALAFHVRTAVERGELRDLSIPGSVHAMAHHILHTTKGFYITHECTHLNEGGHFDPQNMAVYVSSLLCDGMSVSPTHQVQA